MASTPLLKRTLRIRIIGITTLFFMLFGLVVALGAPLTWVRARWYVFLLSMAGLAVAILSRRIKLHYLEPRVGVYAPDSWWIRVLTATGASVAALFFALLFLGALSERDNSQDLPVALKETEAKLAEAKSTLAAKAASAMCGRYLYMSADDLLAKRGKPLQSTVLMQDEFGLVVKWQYTDCELVLKRREMDGLEVYRVMEARATT